MIGGLRRSHWRAQRCRRLVQFGSEILTASGDGRAFAHAAWFALAGLAYLLLEPQYLGWRIVPMLALFGALALIGLFDARYFLIPDGPLVVLFVTGLLTLIVEDLDETANRLLAAGGAYGFLHLVAWGYEKLRGEAGLGAADPKLFAAAGLWLGFGGLPSCLLVAVISALCSALISFGGASLSNTRQPIAFGPHLALGIWLVWAIGPLEPN